MAYVTVDHVRGILARDVTSPRGTAATLYEPDVIDFHISSAAAQVDAVLAGRYAVPFTDDAVPALVVSLTADIASYLCYLTYRQGKGVEPTDPVQLRYDRATGLLDKLSDGSLDLPVTTDPDTGETDIDGAINAGRPRNPYDGTLFGAEDFGLGYGRTTYPSRTWGGPGARINGW